MDAVVKTTALDSISGWQMAMALQGMGSASRMPGDRARPGGPIRLCTIAPQAASSKRAGYIDRQTVPHCSPETAGQIPSQRAVDSAVPVGDAPQQVLTGFCIAT